MFPGTLKLSFTQSYPPCQPRYPPTRQSSESAAAGVGHRRSAAMEEVSKAANGSQIGSYMEIEQTYQRNVNFDIDWSLFHTTK